MNRRGFLRMLGAAPVVIAVPALAGSSIAKQELIVDGGIAIRAEKLVARSITADVIISDGRVVQKLWWRR